MIRERLRAWLESLSFSRRRIIDIAKSQPAAIVASETRLPWEAWDLDPKFFEALTRWTLKNPETSLDQVLDNIANGIDHSGKFLELIPESPFPARGLVGALAHLIRLGITISQAKREVQQFLKEIVSWVGKIPIAFASGDGGTFTNETWKNLTDMRDLINKICFWAAARLEDGRWSQLGHGLLISQEIEEFKTQMNTARNIFTTVTLINLSRAQDTIISKAQLLLSSIEEIQSSQLKLLDMIQKQKEAEIREQFVSQMLSTHAVTKIAYDSQGKRPCDTNTRVEVLQDIENWLYDISDSGSAQSFLWLTGDPGCGKSAVTASTAKKCKDSNILWAQFFINRNNLETTIPASYFPSIARQLANRSPMVSRALHDSLKSEPSLMDDISQLQAGELFVNALKITASTDTTKPVVVIIDGLDETDRSSLLVTAKIFSKALRNLPSNVKVFISSRTEDDIRRPFAETFTGVQQVKHIHLDVTATSSIRDVSTFLIRRIVEIVDHNQLDVMEWPGKEKMDILCERAGGLFIWAVTVTRFIEDQIDMYGKECLDEVLDQLSSQGMGDINTLYGTILTMTHKKDDPRLFARFRQVIGCIVVLKEPLCIADIAELLNLKNPTGSGKPIDVLHFI